MSSYHSSDVLPQPSDDQVEHSSRLIQRIVKHIETAGGTISFRDYMDHCLYEPGLGYYAAGSAKFGAAGDFITAPEISDLFGMTLANHAATLFDQGLENSILEFGAGTGRLCAAIVNRLNELDVSWSSYRILEPSPDLQQRQRRYLQHSLSAHDLKKISWIKQWPQGFNGLVLGNEVLDAMPVNVVLKNQRWIELGVGYNQQKFIWQEHSRNSDAVLAMLQIDADNTFLYMHSIADTCQQDI